MLMFLAPLLVALVAGLWIWWLYRQLHRQQAHSSTTQRDHASELHQASQQLAELQQQMDHVCNALPTGIIVCDAAGLIQHANRSAHDFLDASEGPLAGRMAAEVLPTEVAQALLTVPDEGGSWQGERQTYRERVMQCAIRTVETNKLVIRIDDLDEQMRLEAELVQARKLEVAGQLAGGIAHDFNNILQIIDGASALLKLEQQHDPERVAALAGRIARACTRAADLTRGLLTLAKPRAGGLGDIDIGALLEELVQLCRHTFPRHISVKLVENVSGIYVRGDVGDLHSALLNLTINARDAMASGGEIEIRCTELTLDDERQVQITITDQGDGIPESVLPRIFEPFFTTKGDRGGTGLGLPGARRGAERAQGSLKIDTTPGSGTVATMLLPAIPGGPLNTTATRNPAEVDLRGISVLVVDDEDMIRDMVHDMVTQAGGRCHTAGSAAEAVDWYREHGKGVDLVLMDMVMPNRHGADCLRDLQEMDPLCRAVVMTGHLPSSIEEVIPDGVVVARLDKPFSRKEMLKTVAIAAI